MQPITLNVLQKVVMLSIDTVYWLPFSLFWYFTFSNQIMSYSCLVRKFCMGSRMEWPALYFDPQIPSKYDAIVQLVKDLRPAGCRIDAVGSQSHMHMNTPTLDAIETSLKK